MNRRATSQDVGLEVGLVLSRFFFRSDHLHYGYWADDVEVKIENLLQAQEAYCDFLIDQIPVTVCSVLDVGCGTGTLAQRLTARGLKVDCVSPSAFLTNLARQRLNGSGLVFESRFEEFQTEQKYDLVLFSESFQYVNLQSVFAKAVPMLSPGGFVLICDFFRKEVPGTSRIGGGHRLSKFNSAVAKSPLRIVQNVDITDRAAPTMDLANDVCVRVLSPIWKTMGNFLDSRYPRTMRVVRWTFRKKLEKIEAKYFQGARSGRHFAEFKTYRLYLLRLCPIESDVLAHNGRWFPQGVLPAEVTAAQA